MTELDEMLLEKQIIVPGSKSGNDGQIVVIAGAPASGKNFAITHFTNIEQLYSVIDTDRVQELVLKSDKLFANFKSWLEEKDPEYLEKDDIILRDKEFMFKDRQYVALLYSYVSEKGFIKRALDHMLKDKDSDELPNLAINTTFGNVKQTEAKIQSFIDRGYKKENVHIIWVFTNLNDALQNNTLRQRTVYEPYLSRTYELVFKNMYENIMGENTGGSFNQISQGDFWIIINKKTDTEYYPDGKTIRDFRYVKIRNEGKWDRESILDFGQWIAVNAL